MNHLPQLTATGQTLPETWERSLYLLKKHGINSQKESYTNPTGTDQILEASMKMVVKKPLQEPMLHRGCQGLASLEEYIDEVLNGIKDCKIGKGWDYTYHQRLYTYRTDQEPPTNQIQLIIQKLSKTSHTNRAQAITWIPQKDTQTQAPPCLQRIWCKIINNQHLELHTHWRSREAYTAAFMNMYAMIQLQKQIAEELHIQVGQYVDDSDSYHIYADNFNELENMLQTIQAQKAKGKTPYENSSILKLYRKPKPQ